MNRIFAALFLSAAFLSPVAAVAEIYVIEPGHTRVQYRVNHLGFSDMPGMFYDVKGKIDFDPQKPTDATVEATINADGLTMNHAVLDQKLKGKDFFNTAKYPVITFKSTDIDREGSAAGTMKGKLTMLGVTKPVTLDVTFSKRGWNPYANTYAVGFTATTQINRSDFGMKYLLPAVGDKVSIRIDLEAVKAKPSDLIEKAPVATPPAKEEAKAAPGKTAADAPKQGEDKTAPADAPTAPVARPTAPPVSNQSQKPRIRAF